MAMFINARRKFRIGPFIFSKSLKRWITFKPYAVKSPVVDDFDHNKFIGYIYECGVSGATFSYYRKFK